MVTLFSNSDFHPIKLFLDPVFAVFGIEDEDKDILYGAVMWLCVLYMWYRIVLALTKLTWYAAKLVWYIILSYGVMMLLAYYTNVDQQIAFNILSGIIISSRNLLVKVMGLVGDMDCVSVRCAFNYLKTIFISLKGFIINVMDLGGHWTEN